MWHSCITHRNRHYSSDICPFANSSRSNNPNGETVFSTNLPILLVQLRKRTQFSQAPLCQVAESEMRSLSNSMQEKASSAQTLHCAFASTKRPVLV